MTGHAPDPSDVLPRLPAAYVPRTRLWAALDVATQGAVTVLTAPSGTGKTLGVAGWAHGGRAPEPVRWLRADSSLRPDRLAGLLSGEGLLVIDEAQELSLVCLRLLDTRLDLDPDSMRVLLLTTWDLPFTRLAAELLGDLTILRGDVLLLDDDESASLVRAHLAGHPERLGVADELARAVNESAGGWASVVVLTVRAVAGAADPVALARSYAQDGTGLADRVASKAFSALEPAQRHVLLCLASEPYVTADSAIHLTDEPTAGETLARLKQSGLLVTSLANESDDGPPRFVVHALLAEVVRRRIVAGGAEVDRARVAVVRAVAHDVARRDTGRSLDRLVAMGADKEVLALVSSTGPRLVAAGDSGPLQAWAAMHDDLVDATPGTWLSLALDRWRAGDVNAALAWIDRLVARARSHGDVAPPEVAVARLMRARLGLEPFGPAVSEGERLLDTSAAHDPLVAILLRCELSVASTWTGRTERAEEHAAAAAHAARVHGLPRIEALALTELALVQYAQGRGRPARRSAERARTLVQSPPGAPVHLAARLAVVETLTTLSDLPTAPGTWRPPGEVVLHDADVLWRFWWQIARARMAIVSGSTAEAARALVEPFAPTLPPHLRIVRTTEQVLVAAVAGDTATLDRLTTELMRLDAVAEAALARALRADRLGDVRRACEELELASQVPMRGGPSTRDLVLTLHAQLLDAIGATDAARDVLALALSTTESAANVVPFLDWSWHGSRIRRLLQRHVREHPTPWATDLLAALTGLGDFPGLVAQLGPGRPDPGEGAQDSSAPALSPREQDVLYELARGATYADIAASLFVSQNTVKTHVSSLYAKLGATRRSEALSLARALGLV